METSGGGWLVSLTKPAAREFSHSISMYVHVFSTIQNIQFYTEIKYV